MLQGEWNILALLRPRFASSEVAQHFALLHWILVWTKTLNLSLHRSCMKNVLCSISVHCITTSGPLQPSLCTRVSQLKSTLQYFSISVLKYLCASTSGPSQPSLCTRVSFTSQIYFAVFQYFSNSVFLCFYFRPIAAQFVHKRLLHKSNPIQTSAQAQNSFLLLLRRCDEEKDGPNICISPSMNTIIVLKLIGWLW